MIAGIEADFLTPIAQSLFTHDLPHMFWPFRNGRDRGRSLEGAWKTLLHGVLDQPFSALKDGEAAGWRPSLIFSPMLVEDGRQLLISNLELSQVVRNRGVILGEEHMEKLPDGADYYPLVANPPLAGTPPDDRVRRLLSREGIELFKLFPPAHRTFTLATAARMSGSFPYVLPAATLPTDPPRRVVDAGYYDNYGVGIAASWLFTSMDWVRANTSGVVVVQIRDGLSGRDRRREETPDAAPSLLRRGLQALTSPPEGLYNSRFGGNTFRNDNLLHLLGDFFRARGFDRDFFTTVTFEFEGGNDVALNYTLNDGEKSRLEQATRGQGFVSQVAALHRWWHERLRPTENGCGIG